MNKVLNRLRLSSARWMNRLGLGMRSKLIIIFLLVKVIPLILLTTIAWRQFTIQGDELREISVGDSAAALNDSAVENIERMSTDAALRVAEFLYGRDDDLLYVAGLEPSEENYRAFVEKKLGRLIEKGRWELAPDGRSWAPAERPAADAGGGRSTNPENDDMNGFHHLGPGNFTYENVPLYDEITFVDLDGRELIKVLSPGSRKVNFPLDPALKDVSRPENTYVKAETYFQELKDLRPGEIYVSDVIGAYVGSNYIGMYTPSVVAAAASQRGYEIDYQPGEQAYAGLENPNGRRFEGLVRWATPVVGRDGRVSGYVTLALNHDHIMEFVDHITPMNERYTRLPSAFEGNYAFIWDYRCRSIAHPRHHSIVGFDPQTGRPQIPWLETSIYEGWRAGGLPYWTDYVQDYPVFFEQSRAKAPAAELTRLGLVGLDGRYLNNAPQCTGWMDLTGDGGSGSFYILWSGLYKLNTAAAIPYYTGPYAPSAANGYSKRGFGFVAIGSGLDSFTAPARETETKLARAVADNLRGTFLQLVSTTVILIVLVVLIAIWMASFLTNRITRLIRGISRFRAGERQFRFNAPTKDEFGTLADSFDDMADSIDDSVKNPLSITDMEHRIIYMNDLGLALCRKTLEEVAGAPYGDSSIYPPGTGYDPIIALEEGREAEIFLEENSGRYLKGTANYFLSADGLKIGYLIETSDVTEMVNKQNALEKVMNEAKLANEHKGEFLARMSHEIRTPMNAIIGLTDIVQRDLEEMGGGNPKLEEFKGHTRQIEASSQHLLGLLNDILEISKIEAGKVTLSEETADLIKLGETVGKIIQPRCDEKNIAFETRFDAFEPSTFLTDPLRLRQVLINLLGNAVKFTPELGRIEFRIEKLDRRDGETLAGFLVRDNGIGIAEDVQSSIFQPFEQASGQITRQYGGTGLGLAISRHIVRIFGGDIELRSRSGAGSEFSFSIWLKESAAPEADGLEIADPAGKFVGRRVLLVDDVDLNRKVAKAMLKSTGIGIDEAADGLEALKKFQDSPEDFYDLILMDVLMPNMDGYQASEAIRASRRRDAATVPLIALTANAFKEDIDKALGAGMNAHIAKPVKIDKLLEILFKYISGRGRA
ncbi:MAG: response regulator [Candidatus Adiutrix sp.]|jgi:signal transduction histidine kinase/CheY-like chemotaxis protein/HAMP domain-containing protein|nr:response regulator [Candidatus Adiutrix sp.]